MKTNDRDKVIARLARRSLALVGLLVAGLCFAGPSRAQSSAAPVPAAAASGVAQQLPGLPPAASASSPRPVSATGPAAAAGGTKGAKGKNERVKVNGYWKIEVHDPAGKLASHTEFENSLTTNGTYGFTGDFALAEILGGSNSQMVLADPKTGTNVDIIATGYATGSAQGFIANTKPLIMNGAQFQSAVFIVPFLSIGLNTESGLALLSTPSQGFQDGSVPSLPGAGGPCANAAATPAAFGCLVPTSQALNTSSTGSPSSTVGNQIVLTSSFVAGASTTITQVGTYITPIRLTISGGGTGFGFTASDLADGATPNGVAAYTLTSAPLSTASGCVPTPTAPCAVSVTAGQTIAVTVTLSFQ